MSREEIEGRLRKCATETSWHWGSSADPCVDVRVSDLTALLAENERLERIVIQARKVSDVLRVCGYPVSDAHWKNASGDMSVEARGLHLAATDLRAALNKDPDQ